MSVASVGPTPVNIGGSSYLTGFSYTDARGYLSRLSASPEAMATLYTIPVGSISEPIGIDGSYVVAKITAETAMEIEMRDYLEMVYPYMTQSQSQQDMVQSIFGSEKFQDNFFITFIEQIMGT